MRAWIGCHDNVATNIGGLQRGVSRLLKCEIDQAVVHKIDWPATEQQRLPVEEKLIRVGNRCLESVSLQQGLRQSDFGKEVLLLRSIIHDRDHCRASGTSLTPPFVDEHIDDLRSEVLRR